jgi:twitching motility protein PilU
MIDYRNERRSGHILTLENPIEFVFTHKKPIVGNAM